MEYYAEQQNTSLNVGASFVAQRYLFLKPFVRLFESVDALRCGIN